MFLFQKRISVLDTLLVYSPKERRSQKILKNQGFQGLSMSVMVCQGLSWSGQGHARVLLKSSYFYFKGSKIQIFQDFWQLFLFLLSKVNPNGFFCLQVIFQSSCNQGKSFWMIFESKNRKSCQKSWKIWIFEPLK